jgi:hypothetical protein
VIFSLLGLVVTVYIHVVVQNISQEVKEVQEKKLADLRKLIELQDQSKLERKMALRYRKVKFFGK